MSDAIDVQTGQLTTLDADTDRGGIDDPPVFLDGTLVLVGCGKAKRDPTDPVDLHEAVVGPDEPVSGLPNADTGPAWRAADLYTSSYFAAKRDFAELVTAWTRGYNAFPWAILSAEHQIVSPNALLQPYDTTIDDLGDDPTNPDHRVRNPYPRRRPDGQEIVTELDQWAALVAYGLQRWVAQYRDGGPPDPGGPGPDVNDLLVLAGQRYVEPLRERGVFEYGIARMTGSDPNEGFTFPVSVRFLFEELDAGGIGEQLAWLSDVISRVEGRGTGGQQVEVGRWTGHTRECDRCGTSPDGFTLTAVDGGVFCPACHPEECARCGAWTHETGHGTYPLCEDCQTEYGGQKHEPLHVPDHEQVTLADGGDGADA